MHLLSLGSVRNKFAYFKRWDLPAQTQPIIKAIKYKFVHTCKLGSHVLMRRTSISQFLWIRDEKQKCNTKPVPQPFACVMGDLALRGCLTCTWAVCTPKLLTAFFGEDETLPLQNTTFDQARLESKFRVTRASLAIATVSDSNYYRTSCLLLWESCTRILGYSIHLGFQLLQNIMLIWGVTLLTDYLSCFWSYWMIISQNILLAMVRSYSTRGCLQATWMQPWAACTADK